MISAWASRASDPSSSVKCSSSASVASPISLHGSRCRATSMAPSFTCHEMFCPRNPVMILRAALHGDFHPIHLFDLGRHSPGDQVPLQLPIGGEQAILDCEGLSPHVKRPNLLVVRQL